MQDLKQANDSLAAELTSQRKGHEKEVRHLKEVVKKARAEKDSEVAALVGF